MIDEQKLIPELKDWKKKNGESFDIQDWIACEGNIKLAIGFSSIFWPDFLEHDGCVLLASRFSLKSFNDWTKAEYVMHYGQIESVFNHSHLVDFFSWENQKEINIDQIRYLGNMLKQMYQSKLKSDFPEKVFEVAFNGDEDYEDLYDYEITFYQPQNDVREINKSS